jgi:hypothetical protein
MQRELLLQRDINVSRQLVQEALGEVQNYVLHLLPRRKFEQAHIFAPSYGETVQVSF